MTSSSNDNSKHHSDCACALCQPDAKHNQPEYNHPYKLLNLPKTKQNSSRLIQYIRNGILGLVLVGGVIGAVLYFRGGIDDIDNDGTFVNRIEQTI